LKLSAAGGDIDFSNENLTTTGTLASGNQTVTGTVTSDGLILGEDEKLTMGSNANGEVYVDSNHDVLVQNTRSGASVIMSLEDQGSVQGTWYEINPSYNHHVWTIPYGVTSSHSLTLKQLQVMGSYCMGFTAESGATDRFGIESLHTCLIAPVGGNNTTLWIGDATCNDRYGLQYLDSSDLLRITDKNSADYLTIDVSVGDITLGTSGSCDLSLNPDTGNIDFTNNNLINPGTGHDAFSDFAADDHVDWTSDSGTSENFGTTGTAATGALTVTGTATTDGLTMGEDELITLGSETIFYDSTALQGNNPAIEFSNTIYGDSQDFLVVKLPGTVSYPGYTVGFRVDVNNNKPGVYFKRTDLGAGDITFSQNTGSFTDYHTFGVFNAGRVGDVTHTNGTNSMNYEAQACTFTLVEGSDTITLDPSVAETYTPTNVSTLRSYDADTVAIAELADIVGTLIADLQTTGIIK